MSDYVLTKSDGRICVRFTGEDGKQHEKSFGRGEEAARQAESYCEQWRVYHKYQNKLQAKQEQEELGAGGDPEPKVITFKVLCENFLAQAETNGRSANHINSIRSVCNTIFYQQIGADTPVNKIDYASHILPFLTWLQKTPSEHTGKPRSVITRNQYANFLKTLFNFAVNLGWIEKNPMALWKKQHEPKQTRELDVGDIQKIIDNSPPHLAWALTVAYNTGARTGISELLSLKWSDVDFEQKRLHIFSHKTKKERWIPLSPEFLEQMRQKKAESKCDYIISYNGKRVKSLRKSFNNACAKAGITYPVRMYDIRHRFASELIKSKVPVGVVSRAIGHSRVSTTTDVYLEVLPKEMYDIVGKLPKLTG